MSPRMRNSVIVVSALVLLLAGVLVGSLLKSDSKHTASTSSPSATPTPSATVEASATATASAAATTAPPKSAAPTTAPPLPSQPASANGALLIRPTAQPAVQSAAPDTSDCHLLGDAGWTVSSCAVFVFGDQNRKAYLVEHKAPSSAGAGEAWRAFVLHFSYGHGAWFQDLKFADDTGGIVSGVKAVAVDLTGDGKPELVFGFRFFGSGSTLGYDVVADLLAKATVAVHRELSHGSATFAGGGVTDYEAEYPHSEPNCCPAYFQKSLVSFSSLGWRITRLAQVNNPPMGDF